MIFTYIAGVNLDQLWEIFRRFRGIHLAERQKTPLETVINCFEAILKVLGKHRGSEWSYSRYCDFHLYNRSEFGSIMGDFQTF